MYHEDLIVLSEGLTEPRMGEVVRPKGSVSLCNCTERAPFSGTCTLHRKINVPRRETRLEDGKTRFRYYMVVAGCLERMAFVQSRELQQKVLIVSSFRGFHSSL